jgi:hypothetical protein
MTERVDEQREARERTHDERCADDEPWICRGID